MKKHQFEEITAALSIIITLLAYKFEINWLFYIYFVKSIGDTLCAFYYAFKKQKNKKNMTTTIRNEKLFCLNCGGEFAINYPLPVSEMSQKMKAFDSLHKNCKKTWTEPSADQNQDTITKANWWIGNGQVGSSSKTMWNCLIGNKGFEINHPYDPDDFSRCYKLLQAVPEWKSELHKLKPLSKAWSNLVDNWDTLTEMYERNNRERWKTYKEIGMYELMEKLIR
jgi:hypothetical protein